MRTQRLLVMLTSLILLLSAATTVASATPTTVALKATQNVKRLGTTRITGSASTLTAAATLTGAGTLNGELRPDADAAAGGADREIKNAKGTSPVPSSDVPRPPVQRIVDATGSTAHFGGLTHFDQRTAGTGAYANTQGSLEPPDQGLCASATRVVETVNTVIRVRNMAGGIVQAAMPLNDFFNLSPEIIRSNPLVFGEFTSDPKCYYDAPTRRWFVSLLELDVDSATGGFTGRSHLLLAVSQTSDPTSDWNLFSIDITNDGANGTPRHRGCKTGCFGDQPLIGADANGLYVTTNEYPTFVAGFNGANVYAFSKAGLEANTIRTVTMFFEPTLAEGQAYSLQPSTTPPGASYATENNGTEYFLSALEFTGGLDNRIALWAITNTKSLSSKPDLSIQVKVLRSEVYGLPASAMDQRGGSAPLRDLLKSELALSLFGVKPMKMPISFVNANDDRMNQAVYLRGRVWGALNTRVKGPTGAIQTGIAWFDTAPSWRGGVLGGSVAAQGYVAVRDNHVAFPSVAANASGKVIVAFSLLGKDYFPSAAYAELNPSTGTGPVRVVKWGNGPQDGFTGYVSLDPGDGGISRWGDYSAAVADPSGNIWFATETINQSCTFAAFKADASCGGTRTILANWGSTIAKVAP